MQKLVVASALILGISGTAQAGFFDSVLSDQSAAVEKVSQVVATEKSTATSPMTDSAMDMAAGLIPTLTQQLGVTETQAQGGMGSLLGMAKQSLSSGEFEQLGAGVPGMDTLLAAAPALSGGSKAGGLGSMLSGAGGLASSVGGMAQLTQQFEALGLSSDMIAQFANIAVQYFSQGGNATGGLLEKGLASILG
ncbi:DUF2780 domain-containing protein [Alkalimarinus alittae]|uniref:DUF2780 domain-containing protein n=1 Tax=Alkalimarinus alittae TaxID=2961619 RepID=A0ABY6N406_9ALTE|nr:DUF2780 domain-containing protein [Alkalimarinus alittae]UZE96826.1 DUF2780 domain-containing protein [Alkalimarinus alittae]